MTRAGALLLGLVLVPGTLTHASEIGATARDGESFGALALRTLGDEQLGELVASHNGISRLRAGATVRLPVARGHRVRAGESWQELAEHYWSDRSLAPYLALFSGHRASEPPPAGEEVLIPALARYRLRQGETLARLARVFLRDVAFAEPLAGLNRFEDPRRLGVGTPVLVPVRQRAIAPPASAADDAGEALQPVAGSGPQPPAGSGPARQATRQELPGTASSTASSTPPVGASASSEHTEEILQAVNSYLDADFDAALERLEGLRGPVLESGSTLDRAMLLRHLIYVYVAYDRRDDACVMYQALLAVDAEPAWDPDLVSPRILDTVRSCPVTAER